MREDASVGYVDSYCERVAPGFWGEPLNSASNLAFLAAALLSWWLIRRGSAPKILALPVLIALIFIGSATFHTTATPWGAALDSGFIAIFLLYYIALFANLFWDLPWRRAWLAAPIFLAFTIVVALVSDLAGFRGPGMYLAALLGLAVLSLLLARSPDPTRRAFWPAFALPAAVFAVSLTLRTLDSPLCSTLPIGTHFAWHLLNAYTLYLVTRAAIHRWHSKTPRSASLR
jgi:hypothetical protein